MIIAGMRSLLLVSMLMFALTLPIAAHPAWGIVVDRNGRVVYSDLETVWRIGADGRPTVLRPGLSGHHVHELFLDERGNLYGEDYTYTGTRFVSTYWKMTPSGAMTPSVGPGILRDRDGNRYEVIENNHTKAETRIVKHTASGITPFVGSRYGLRDGKGAAAQFSNIVGLAIAADGALYATDGGAVRKIAPDGTVTTLARGLDVDRDAREPLVFGGLMGIAIGKDAVYAADFRNRRIVRVTFAGAMQVIARSTPPYSPTGVAVAPNGDVWVLEAGYRPGATIEPRARKLPR